MKPGENGFKRLIDASGYSIKGISACWRSQVD
jgi:diacylglycerol kinase